MSYVIIYRPILHVSKCNMSLGMTDPNFQEDLGIIPLFMGKVNVVADITSDHYVSRGSIIPFDQKILDNTNSFVLNNSTFIGIKSISFKKIPKKSDLPKIVRMLPPDFM